MEDVDVRRDSFTYSSAIGTCGAVGRWEEAISLIQTMKNDDARPNRVAYTSAISACARASQWDSAKELFHLMKIDFKTNLLDYVEYYPSDLPAAVDAESLKFVGKEKDRARCTQQYWLY
jgi:pentatricopeptide repeat protein